jgi:thiol-disulfide isomerase/thioredoxin
MMMRLIVFMLLAFPLSLAAQTDSIVPAYKRFPTLPPFQILLSDSSTVYTKAQLPSRKPVFMMVFSPECSHCQHAAEELHQFKKELKDVQVVMVTMHPLDKMKQFIEKYKLAELANVVVGQDIYYFMPGFFAFRNLPFMALYSKKGNLISTSEGGLPIMKVVEELRGEW